MDPKVLDRVLTSENTAGLVRSIVKTDTFELDDQDKLTAEEENEVKQMLNDEQLKRFNPQAWYAKQARLAQSIQAPAQPSSVPQARPHQPPSNLQTNQTPIQRPAVPQARSRAPQVGLKLNPMPVKAISQAGPRSSPSNLHLNQKFIQPPPPQARRRQTPPDMEANRSAIEAPVATPPPAVPRAGAQAQSREPKRSPPRVQTSQPTAQRRQGPQAQVQAQPQQSQRARLPMAQTVPSAKVAGSGEPILPRGFANLELAQSAPAIPRTNSKVASHPSTPKGSGKKETRIVPPQKQHSSPYRSPSPLPMDAEDAVRTNATQRAESPSSDELAHTPTRKPTSKGTLTKSRGRSPILGSNTQPVRSETPELTSSPCTSPTQTPSSRSMTHGDEGKPKASQEDIKNVCILPYSPKFRIAPPEDKSQLSSDADIVSQGQASTSVRSRSVGPKNFPRVKLRTRSLSDIDGRKALLAFSRTFSQGHNNRIGDAILRNKSNDETTPPVFAGDPISDQDNTFPIPSQSTPPRIDTPSPSASASSSPLRNAISYIRQKIF